MRQSNRIDRLTREGTLRGERTVERVPYGYVLRPPASGPASSTTGAVAFAVTAEPGSDGGAAPRGTVFAALLAVTLASSVFVAILRRAEDAPPEHPVAVATVPDAPLPPSAATPWDTGLPAVAKSSSGGALRREVRPKRAGRPPKVRAVVRNTRGDGARETAMALDVLRKVALETPLAGTATLPSRAE
jgi:hypothetical protein